MDLRVVVVDNGSASPLSVGDRPNLSITVLRSEVNLGGSGGFNLGIATALRTWNPEFLWLLDSDARVLPSTLGDLLDVLLARRDAWAVGPAISESSEHAPHEIGGMVDRRRGTLGPAPESQRTGDEPLVVDYVPSCCLLARSSIVRSHGLMPDLFLNGDDAEWCVRLSKRSGLHVLAVPAARAVHPRFDRHATWARFYQARNGFGVIRALDLPRRVYFRRAMVEVSRAINQAMLGRDDLAELHLRGLRATQRGERIGAHLGAREGLLPQKPIGPLRAQLGSCGATLDPGPGQSSVVRRLLRGPPQDLAEVGAKGGPASWFAARTLLVRDGEQGIVLRPRWPRPLFRAMSLAVRGTARAIGIWLRPPLAVVLPPAPMTSPTTPPQNMPEGPGALSVVVLSYNRKESLRETLAWLAALSPTRGAELIVVDNNSSDGSVEMVRREFPDITLIVLEENVGVAGFNRGVAAAKGEFVLILDDDARPDARSVRSALEWMASHPFCGAVPLLPRHPRTGDVEWPFAGGGDSAIGEIREDWPVMGSGNLVRKDAWDATGGYEERFFLYRNDTDLAMKLLASGRSVAFNAEWFVWHDSPAARSKTARWCRLATRNWVWLAKRHGRGLSGILGAIAGWAWAHRLAGWSLSRQWSALCGACEGVWVAAPKLLDGVEPDGRAFARLVGLQVRSSGRGAGSLPRIVSPTVGAGEAGAGGGEDPPLVTITVGHSRAAGASASSASRARHSA